MSSLGVVSDGVVGLQSEPLRQRSVLLGSLAQFLLDLEALVSLDVSTEFGIISEGELDERFGGAQQVEHNE